MAFVGDDPLDGLAFGELQGLGDGGGKVDIPLLAGLALDDLDFGRKSHIPYTSYITRLLSTQKTTICIAPQHACLVKGQTSVTCTCGAVYNTISTVPNLRIGICSACHPYFTGEQRFIDTAGRVDKFAQRYGSTRARRTAPKLEAAAPAAAPAAEA